MNEEIKFSSYTGPKDIIQFVLLYKFGGIAFDLDIILKDKVRELTGVSNYGYYCSSASPYFFASAPRSAFSRLGLTFFARLRSILKFSPVCKNFDFGSYRKRFPSTATLLTTGSMIPFANRILELKTSEANRHKYAILDKCAKCQNSVFTFDITKSLELMQNDLQISEYVGFLKTPSSRKIDDFSEVDGERIYGIDKLNFAIFQTFIGLIGGEKLWDCLGQ